MSRPPLKIDTELEASLRRMRGALEQNRTQYAGLVEQIMSDTAAQVAERISAKTDRITARIAEKHQRRLDKWERAERRRREHELREDSAAIPRGIVFAVVAITMLVIGITRPPFFWMIFVALGLGMSAVSSFERAFRRKHQEREQGSEAEREGAAAAESTAARTSEPVVSATPPAEPTDPKVARIQALCDKILAELESGPPIVREVVTEPRATIDGLRQACLQTARRERELRSVLEAQDEVRLITERDALAVRVTHESDAIVRDRLGQALAALEEQLAHRAELRTAATRLEAENTRILYTLENLHMQLLRARSTDIGAPELGGRLRDSLRELGTQIDAVTEALEFASAPSPATQAAAPAVPPPIVQGVEQAAGGPEAGADADANRADAERAERQDAARRAAQAREAQRQR